MRDWLTHTHTGSHWYRCHRSSGRLLLLLMLAGLLAPAALAIDWTIERVDDAFSWPGSSISIAVTADGVPHIAHGAHSSQILRYAVDDGSGWSVKEADTYPSGLSASIALDLDENPCIAYHRAGWLIFSRLTGGAWVRETVDSMNYNVKTAIQTAGDGTPHVVYSRSGAWRVTHAQKPEDAWLTSQVDSTISSGNGLSLAVDAPGNPHVVHWGAPSFEGPFETRYSTWDGGEWQNDIVDDTGGNCNVIHSGIAVDALGIKHLAFESHTCANDAHLTYAVGDAGSWELEIVDNFEFSAGCSLVLDDTGSPHIVYGTGYVHVGGWSELRYAHLDAEGEWVVEVVDDLIDAGEFNSLAIDAAGYLHIAYFRGNGYDQNGELMYARSTTPVGGGCAGDIDGDGDTDLSDLASLLAVYGTVVGDPLYDPAADFDVDGDVDLSDLAFLLGDYGCGG